MHKLSSLFLIIVLLSVLSIQISSCVEAGANEDKVPLLLSDKYIRLDYAMRKLWKLHSKWTYSAVDAYYNNARAFEPRWEKVVDNQKEIGILFAAFYGEEGGDTLSKYFLEYVSHIPAVLSAIQKENKLVLDKHLVKWEKDAQLLSEFFSTLNPEHWSGNYIGCQLKQYREELLVYSREFDRGNYENAIRHYDNALQYTMKLADFLAEGLAQRYPERINVKNLCISPTTSLL